MYRTEGVFLSSTKHRYVLTLKLRTEKFQEDILNKRFEIGRQMYNSVLNVALKRYNEMIKTKRWRINQDNISNIYTTESNNFEAKKLAKKYFDIKKEMLKEFRISEYSFHEDVKYMQHHFKDNISSMIAQKIATSVWKAFEDLLYKKGEKIYFKSYKRGFNSLEGKNNRQGIIYKQKSNIVKFLRLNIKIQPLNNYEQIALKDRICYCRIIRKFVKNRYKYYLQVVLEGKPPIKIDRKNGEIKNNIGCGDCGIDIGTQTIAYVSDYGCKLYELAPRVQNIESEKRKLLRYMDRSRRSTNPKNFNDDRTIKKGVRLMWNYSNKYIKAKNKLRDLYRKQADIRKQDHNIMCNEIIRQCDTIKVETMNFKGLQARVKNTAINDKTGKINRKKRFGRSLENKAPSMFLTILENKVKSKGGKYIEVNTYKVKASQYNHLNQEYNKKKLSQRWNYFNDIRVQRDLYSAFLIKNVEGLETINNTKCIEDFDNFMKYHNKEILRLQGLNNLSSMGI